MALAQLELWTARVATPHRAALVALPALPPIIRETPTSDRVVATAWNMIGLDPLPRLDATAQFYVDNARADGTRAAYARDFRLFERWCSARGLRSLPANSNTLARYLTDLAQCGRKTSTIRRARIAIGLAHADAGAPRPDRDAIIRTLERGIGRIHGTREEGAPPLLLEQLVRLVATLGLCARDDRDRALLLLGFTGAFRAGELVGLNIDDVAVHENGMTVHLARSKEDPLRRGVHVEIARAKSADLCAVNALQRWLGRVGQGAGPLLRTVLGERVLGARMPPRSVSRVVHRLALRAGLKDADDYSAHSLRAGLATSAYARGVTEREIQAHGRWKDRRSLDRYIHIGAVPGRSNLVSALL